MFKLLAGLREKVIFLEKRAEAKDSSSLNYSAGVLVVAFHKAQTFRTDLSFRLQTVRYFILVPNLFFVVKLPPL